MATEFALVAVRRTQVQLWVEQGRRGAAAAAEAIRHLDDAIAATQLGITLASIGLGFVGEPALARLVQPLLASIGLGSMFTVHSVSIALAFGIITFLHALVRLLGVTPAVPSQSVHSSEELSLLVSEARKAGRIRPYAGRILGNVFRISATRVRDVMVHRQRVLAIDVSTQPEDLLDLLRETGFTRIPVYAGEVDNVVGILHTKDLFHLYARERVVILQDVLRPIFEMRPDLPVVDAVRRFRRERQHLALVRESGGPLLGVCTLEDVLEEIVGEIEDEHDQPTAAGGE